MILLIHFAIIYSVSRVKHDAGQRIYNESHGSVPMCMEVTV